MSTQELFRGYFHSSNNFTENYTSRVTNQSHQIVLSSEKKILWCDGRSHNHLGYDVYTEAITILSLVKIIISRNQIHGCLLNLQVFIFSQISNKFSI